MKSLRTLFLTIAVVGVLLPQLVLGVWLSQSQESFARETLDRSLLLTVTMVARTLGPYANPDLQRRIEALGERQSVRLTVIDSEGRVLADSEADPGRMESHANRPEVQGALTLGQGKDERMSQAVGEPMRYIAVAEGTGASRRIFRAAAPVAQIEQQTRRTQTNILAGAAALLALSVLLLARLSRYVLRPLRAINDATTRFTAGEPAVRVLPDGPVELHRLGSSYNAMVERFNSQLRRLDEAQGNVDAILGQMPEGLLVLDGRGMITRANPAAAVLVGMSVERILHRPLLAVLLSYTLDHEVTRALEGDATSAVDVRLPEGRSLRVTLGPLRVSGQRRGAVVLLQDLTELRRTDEMRRDFVANVSHELRTPVASIRAMVETLMLRSAKRPELLAEYGPRIVTECERVDDLVRDLMLLAETEAGQLSVQPEPLQPKDVAEEVVRQVAPLAAEAETQLVLEEFAPGKILADRYALSQCIRNLVDNAVRYAPGGAVRVGGRLQEGQMVLYIADNGPGIPSEDLPRIFERFYRVDKARSRERGGSGLGLSIVRHLAELQGGRSWVESQEGKGSTFYLSFPLHSG